LVLLLIVVLVASNSGGGGKTATGTTTAPPTSTVPSTTGTTPPTTAATGVVTPLAQLLPRDVDGTADCTHNTSPPSGLKGIGSAVVCTPKNLPNGEIFAFQFDNATDFAASVVALNKFKGFDPLTAGDTCPPGSNAEDQTGWHNNSYPARTGQILECLSVGTNNTQPDYIWMYPTQYVIIDAQAASGSSFADLDTWWTKNGPPPG
jgi:hypothetical protein